MPKERLSIHNFLRAGEILLQDHAKYSQFEQTLVQAMLSRLSAKMKNQRDPEEDP